MNTGPKYFYVMTSSVEHTEKTKKVLAALREAGGEYIDDHNDRPGFTDKYVVLSKLEKDGVTLSEQHVCWAGDDEYFSLNPMEIDEDGCIHLRQPSVASVVYVKRHGGLKCAVERHNTTGRMFNPEFLEIIEL